MKKTRHSSTAVPAAAAAPVASGSAAKMPNEAARLLKEYVRLEKEAHDDEETREELLTVALRLLQVHPPIWDEKELDKRLWKLVFVKGFDTLRAKLGENSSNSDTRQTLLAMLARAQTFFSACIAARSASANGEALASRLYLCLGDTYRYSSMHCEEDEQATTYQQEAIRSYVAATKLMPGVGQPFNQLATIALGQKQYLDAVYYYVRSMAAAQQPFDSARDAITNVFLKVQPVAPSQQAKKRSTEVAMLPSRSRRQLEAAKHPEIDRPFGVNFASLVGCFVKRMAMDSYELLKARVQKDLRMALDNNFDEGMKALSILLFVVSYVTARDGTSAVLASDALSLIYAMLLRDVHFSDDTKLLHQGAPLNVLAAWLATSPGIDIVAEPGPTQLHASVHTQFWSSLAQFANRKYESSSALVVFPEAVLLQEFAPLKGWTDTRVPSDISTLAFVAAEEVDESLVNARRSAIGSNLLVFASRKIANSPLTFVDGQFLSPQSAPTLDAATALLSVEESDEEDTIAAGSANVDEPLPDDSEEMVKLKQQRAMLRSKLGSSSSAAVSVDPVNRRPNWRIEPHRSHIVLDTNLLMGSLSVAKEILGSRQYVVVVPIVVVSELRGLSNDKEDAIQGLVWLEDAFASPASAMYVRCLTNAGSLVKSMSFHVEDTNGGWMANDDRILSSAKNLKAELERTAAAGAAADVAQVVLVTDDANLRVKAHAESICTFHSRDLLSKLSTSSP